MVERAVMVHGTDHRRSPARYWALVIAAFAAAFVVGVSVAHLSVWIMGGQMGHIEGYGKYVAIIISLVCAATAYLLVLKQAFKFKPKK